MYTEKKRRLHNSLCPLSIAFCCVEFEHIQVQQPTIPPATSSDEPLRCGTLFISLSDSDHHTLHRIFKIISSSGDLLRVRHAQVGRQLVWICCCEGFEVEGLSHCVAVRINRWHLSRRGPIIVSRNYWEDLLSTEERLLCILRTATSRFPPPFADS